MSSAKRWIAVSAVSALGIGMLATGAMGVANAIPLVDSTTMSEVPPISTVPGESKGGPGAGVVPFPVPTSAAAPSVTDAPAPAPQPVAPQPAAPTDDSVASPDSPDSPASIDD